MTTKNAVIVFIVLVLGILVGRCSAPGPQLPHRDRPMADGAVISSGARDCVLDNMSTANTDRAFDFLVSDCNRQAAKSRGL